MTQEDKELLFKDLCARLPYGVKIQVYYEDIAGSGYFDETVWLIDNDEPFHVNDRWIENVKPYLRPLSSMTEEELKEFQEFRNITPLDWLPLALDWLLEHHFDFRGLIPKGLAIEVTESNNPYK